MSRANIAMELEEMEPFAAGAAAARSIVKSEDGILLCYGTTVPTDATAGYAKGCLFIHTDGAAGTMIYCNEGSNTSCDFDAVSVA